MVSIQYILANNDDNDNAGLEGWGLGSASSFYRVPGAHLLVLIPVFDVLMAVWVMIVTGMVRLSVIKSTVYILSLPQFYLY